MSQSLVVYTAVFGDYDVVLEPNPIEDAVDYICFTDCPHQIPDIWETREVDAPNLSKKLKSGLVKTQPHRFLSEYERSIWVDANLAIIGRLSELAADVLGTTDLAVPKHRTRNCIYQEAETCMKHDISDKEITKNKMDEYREAGFPEEYGLSETRILVRNHKKADIIAAMDCWWDEYRTGPERDQLSFEYAAWKTNLDYHQLNPQISVSSEYFKYYPHKVDTAGKEVFEILLRNRYQSDPIPRKLIWMPLLFVYLKILPALRAVLVLYSKGPVELWHRFRRRYLKPLGK